MIRRGQINLAVTAIVFVGLHSPQVWAQENITVLDMPPPGDVAQREAQRPEARPPVRGYKAPILAAANDPWPYDPSSPNDAKLHEAAGLVAERLARDGLLNTLAQALHMLGPAAIDSAGRVDQSALRRIGIPTDLLTFFPPPQSAPADTIADYIHRRLAAGQSIESLQSELQSIPFEFRPSLPDFRITTESGDHKLGMIRLQVTRGDYWTVAGAGDGLDVTLQLIENVPEAEFLISIEQKHLDPFLSIVRGKAQPQTVIRIAPHFGTVAQWAADNGKAGVVGSILAPMPARVRHATIVPRYASRRQDGSVYVPHESLLMDSLDGAGFEIVQSPLVFQGGNIMAVVDPATDERIMLLGEAEVHRNTALGLTREQIIDAFRIEFNVDRVEVLPAVSFHVDYDVSVRVVGDRLVAIVNNPDAAVLFILRLGLDVLEQADVLAPTVAAAAREHMAADRNTEFYQLIVPLIQQRMNADGTFPLSFVEHFSTGPDDSGVGNFQRFMLALDYVMYWSLAGRPVPDNFEPHLAAYMRSFARAHTARVALENRLRDLGFQVVAIPSLSEGSRSINYINGVHSRDHYLMPAYGGLFAPLDDVAKQAFEQILGPDIKVIPILCGESQRRDGAIHCSVGVYPRLR